MPDDESSSEDMELSNKKNEPLVITKEHIQKIRNSLGKHGHKIGNTSSIVDKYIGKEIKPNYKSPVKRKINPKNELPGSTGDIRDFIQMAQKGQNFKMGNKLKNKIRGKRN